MPLPTLLDIAQSTGDDGIAALIEEVIKVVPEVALGAARTVKGTQYKTTVRTGLPNTTFRQANLGGVLSKSKYENRLYECSITDTPWTCDKAIADAHEDGAAAYIASEAKGIMLAQTIMLGRQFYYGKPMAPGDATVPFSDPLGFPGLLQMYDVANMTVDAAGTTAGTASSVWAVSWGDDGVQWLYGNGSNPLQLTDVKTIVVPDANGNLLTQYHQQLLAWVGLKLASMKRVACIKNITADSGKTLNDAKMYDLEAIFPVGYRPDCYLMSRRSVTQLVKSRTATTTTGVNPPVPTEFNGIPIVLTDSIQNTEALR